jgi:hypothetical protein
MLWILSLLSGCSPDYGLAQETREVYITTADTDDYVVEGFEQPPKVNELDIVVVVDKSGSMSSEFYKSQEAIVELHSQASSFIPDFRMMFFGIGRESTKPPVILDSSSTETAVRAAFVSVDDDNDESAFQVLFTASTMGYQPSYYRPTSIFVISDEEDSSDFTPDLFVDYINDVAYAPWEFNAITPLNDTADCSGAAQGYRTAAWMTGGNDVDLCSENWDLFGGSKFSYEPITEFTVSGEPIDGTMRVYYDLVLQPESSWSFVHPVVYFADEPPPGTSVTVAYEEY